MEVLSIRVPDGTKDFYEQEAAKYIDLGVKAATLIRLDIEKQMIKRQKKQGK